MKPLVSISCITYNHEQYIAATLDAMISQKTNFDFEILIHDDASTDKTADIIRDYVSRYPNIIKPIFQSRNQYSRGIHNISGMYNFPRASGRYIAMCEGDDIWCDCNKLQKQIDYMMEHPACSLCFHSAHIITEGLELAPGMMRPYKRSQIVTSTELIGDGIRIPMASMVFLSSAVVEMPEFYTQCMVGDIPLELMLADKGYAYYIDEPMSKYRFGIKGSWTNDMLSGDYKRKQHEYVANMKEMYRGFDEYSQKKYHIECVRAYRRIRFLSAVNCKEWKIIYAPASKEYRRELGVRDRFFLLWERRLPKSYNNVRKLWLKKNKI